MDEIQLIRKLKWVKDVTVDKEGIPTIVTKPRGLRIQLTNFITVEPGGDGQQHVHVGTSLGRTKIFVGLPSYKLKLGPERFLIGLTEIPPFVRDTHGTMPIPTAISWGKKLLLARGTELHAPCLGSYVKYYEEAKGYVAKAIIAATYLQTAKPDWEGTGRRSMYAYGLGLVGEEIIQPSFRALKTQTQ